MSPLVIVGVVVAVLALAYLLMVRGGKKIQAREAASLAHSVPGIATVVERAPAPRSGEDVHYPPFDITLDVDVRGWPPYRVVVRWRLAAVYLSEIDVDEEIDVLVDTRDPGLVRAATPTISTDGVWENSHLKSIGD